MGEFVDINFIYPDETEETVPIEKDVFLKICDLALKENKTVEKKFLEILDEILEEEGKNIDKIKNKL